MREAGEELLQSPWTSCLLEVNSFSRMELTEKKGNILLLDALLEKAESKKNLLDRKTPDSVQGSGLRLGY
jgi:hypothetical protein